MTLFVNSPATRGGIQGNKTEQQIRETFQEADRDGDGNLNKEEIQYAFNKLGAHVPAWRANRGLHHADTNHDGVVSGEQEANDLIKYALDKYGYKV